MRRIMKKSFTFEKNRYLITLDTDNMKLYLICYLGGSEKNDKIELKEQSLRQRVYTIIREESGSGIASNALGNPNKISNEVRKYNQIPFPEMPEWDELLAEILESGKTELLGRSDEFLENFLEYLVYKDVKVVHFKHRNNNIVMDARRETFRVRDFLKEIDNELNTLKKLHAEVFDKMDRIQYKTGDKDSWMWKL